MRLSLRDQPLQQVNSSNIIYKLNKKAVNKIVNGLFLDVMQFVNNYSIATSLMAKVKSRPANG